MKKALVVAHPDDEVLFFSSVLETVDQIIVCFGPSSNDDITNGRKELQSRYPLKNVEWLNVDESNVFLSGDWNSPKLYDCGMNVSRNKNDYEKNFNCLAELLKLRLSSFDVVYTHNPWGEYGHEEHISVFKAVCVATKSTKPSIYVSCYLSDRSKQVFDIQKGLLGPELIVGSIPTNLCQSIKSLYMENNCWTWIDDYMWPDTELFIKISDLSVPAKNKYQNPTANPPILLLTISFKQSLLGALVRRLLPKTLKTYIKNSLKKVRK